MSDFWQKNTVSIIIAIGTLVSSYVVNTALYGYRITTLENRADRQEAAVTVIRDDTTAMQISLARIETDIQYIKQKVDKL